jgi:uncharacterized membrane protein YbhN (UPF0104 family)
MKTVILALKVGAAIAVMWALIAYGALDVAALSAAVASPLTLVTVTGLMLLTYVLSAYRWRILLECQSIKITVHEAAGVTFFTYFAGNFLPGGMVTGDAVRIAYAVKTFSARKTAVVMSVFADRLIGLYAMLLVCCAVALLNPAGIASSVPLRFLAVTAGVLFLTASVGLCLFYFGLKEKSDWVQSFVGMLPQGVLAHIVHQCIEVLRLYRRAPLPIMAALGVSVTAFTIGVICVMIIGDSMKLGTLASIDYGFAAPWAWMANLLPVTLGGLGVGEAAFDRICHWQEATHTTAAYGTIFLVYRIVTIVATLPGLVVYLFHRGTFKLSARLPDEN